MQQKNSSYIILLAFTDYFVGNGVKFLYCIYKYKVNFGKLSFLKITNVEQIAPFYRCILYVSELTAKTLLKNLAQHSNPEIWLNFYKFSLIQTVRCLHHLQHLQLSKTELQPSLW